MFFFVSLITRLKMTKYIPEESLKGLHLYKYGGVDKSLVSKYVLGPYWNNLVKIFPLWVA